VWPQEGHCEKRCEIQDSGQEMAVMVGYSKSFNTTIWCQFLVKCEEGNTSLPELSLLKVLLLTYIPSQPFLGRHLGISHLFSQWPSWGCTLFFTAGLFLD